MVSAAHALAQPVGAPTPVPRVPAVPQVIPQPPTVPPALPAPPLPPLPPLPALDVMRLAREAASLAEGHLALLANADEMAQAARLMSTLHFDDIEFHFQEGTRSAEARAKAREDASRQQERGREARAYEEAIRHVYESRWDRAVERFNDVIALKGPNVAGALYWKAYAQDRQGLRPDALATIVTLTREHAGSPYLKQARALEAEVRRNAGQPARPQDQEDEDLKLMAIAALQNSAPEQAVPMLEKLLAGNASPKLKERALFVRRAISYLGMHGGRESHAILAEIYGSTTDVDMKKRILRSLAMGGEKDRILTAARSEPNPELRAEAVRQLGMHGADAELSQLYAKETSVEIKKQIISAMAMGGNGARLSELAKSEQNPELRRAAIRSLGMVGGNGTGDTLVQIYGSERDVNVKKAVISALGMQDNATALVAIARKEQDSALKREIVSRLSHMNSKVATEYLLEIINK
jgi:HEAT repeat protein